MRLSIIVAVAANGVIGDHGRLPWHLPADLRRFKRLTMGHHLILGRRTWESIGRPLPGRRMVVVSRRGTEAPEGVAVVGSLAAALELAAAAGEDEAFVAGGAEIYRLALPQADRLHLTRIHGAFSGDVCFPAVSWDEWELIERQVGEERSDAARGYDFELWERRGRTT